LSAASKLVERVTGVKQTGAGRWIARCPAHEDKSPSLSIRETDDGRVLIHDFGGCAVDDVLAALDLRFSDLFDKPLPHHNLPPVRGGFSAHELLELGAHEVWVACLLISDATNRSLSADDRSRLAQACARLTKAKDMANAH